MPEVRTRPDYGWWIDSMLDSVERLPEDEGNQFAQDVTIGLAAYLFAHPGFQNLDEIVQDKPKPFSFLALPSDIYTKWSSGRRQLTAHDYGSPEAIEITYLKRYKADQRLPRLGNFVLDKANHEAFHHRVQVRTYGEDGAEVQKLTLDDASLAVPRINFSEEVARNLLRVAEDVNIGMPYPAMIWHAAQHPINK